jgi:hypothetical protein
MNQNETKRIREGDEKMGWKHPYVLYILLTLALFLFLILIAYLAVTNDWIPKR